MSQSRSRIAAIVLTKDEALHIARCLQALRPIASTVLVVDSHSSDSTVEIARAQGARVVQHPFTNQAAQINWALESQVFDAEWILRVDADEFFDEGAATRLAALISTLPATTSGVLVDRQMSFLGGPIRFGGVGRTKQLRAWRNGKGRCESRWMDEHVVLSEGEVFESGALLTDDNRNDLAWWIAKHNNYSSREAAEELARRHGLEIHDSDVLPNPEAARKRWIKRNLYGRLPLGWRAVAYFLYRYFLRLGFLDGYRGFMFHFLQGLWYRVAVDAKIYEVERDVRRSGQPFATVIREKLGISLEGS